MWCSSDGICEKNPSRLVCFVALVKEVGGKSESEVRTEFVEQHVVLTTTGYSTLTLVDEG